MNDANELDDAVEGRSYYEILEVEPGATARQIRDAYERSLKLLEGNNVAGYNMLDEDSQRELRGEIEEAYSVLSDPGRRAQYDERIGTEPPRTGRPRMRFLRPVEDVAKERSGPRPVSPARAPSRPNPKAPSPAVAVADAPEDAPPSPGEDVEVNGAYLRALREAKGLSVQDVARATRVPKSYVVAMEAEDLEAMPARVFVRGFLTQIARPLGVDRARLADGYVRTVLKE